MKKYNKSYKRQNISRAKGIKRNSKAQRKNITTIKHSIFHGGIKYMSVILNDSESKYSIILIW